MAVKLNAEYLAQQITRMESAIDNDPELAIGTAKEFIETISKLILEQRNVPYGKNDDLQGLVKLTVKQLKVVPDGIQNKGSAEDAIKRLMNNLTSMGSRSPNSEICMAPATGKMRRTRDWRNISPDLPFE